MGKLTSGRVKRKPQTGITSDRYQYLGLDQAEPNLGDPLVGPSSIGANPIPVGPYFSLLAIGNNPGKRYWGTPAGISSYIGVISVYNQGILPDNTFSQINGLNFVGSGVTVETPSVPFAGSTGIATVRISVIDVKNQGSVGQILYNSPSGLAYGISDVYYTSGNVGIGSTVPESKLTVAGDVYLSSNGKLTSNSNTLYYQTRSTNNSSFFGIYPNGTGNQSAFYAYGNSSPPTSSYVYIGINTSSGFAEIQSGRTGLPYPYYPLIFTLGGSERARFSTDGNFGIGLVNPTSRLHVSGNALVTGIVTATTFVGNLTGTASLATTALSVGGGGSGSINAGVTSVTQLFVSGISTLTTLNVTGLTTTRNLFVGSGATVNGDLYLTNKLGINTASAQYNLDVVGSVGIVGKIFLSGDSGTADQVLLSGGTSNPRWGSPTGVTVGSANSVGVANTQLNAVFYPTFTAQSQNNGLINVNTTGLVYNPSTNRLGIGTTTLTAALNIGGGLAVTGFATIGTTLQVNGSTLFANSTLDRVGIGTTNPTTKLTVIGDVLSNVSIANTISIGNGQNQITTGVVTSVNTNTQVLDSFSTSTIRSAKYKVQVTTNGQLIGSASSTSSRSVSSLAGGSNYVSGNYSNISLSTLSGTGADARANIIINPEIRKSLLSIVDGRINFDSTTGINLNTPIIFDKAVPATDADNSKVTSVRVTNFGSGYTSVPTVTFSTPTNNPAIPGVGVASTAIGEVATMLVANVKINTPGVHTTIPTVSFKPPIGAGLSATGLVGFGISTIKIDNSGSNYIVLPSISISAQATTPAVIGISSLIVTNLRISNIGFGYTIGNYPTLQFGNQGNGTGLTATVSSLGISDSFIITPGIGHTTPPTLTVESPTVGINTATITCTLGISTMTVVRAGTGYTVSPNITFSGAPGFVGFNGVVGLGLTGPGISLFPGSGYGSIPTVTVQPVGGIGTGAQLGVTVSGNSISALTVINPGFGYTVAPLIVFSGGDPVVSAAATVTGMIVRNVSINNTGYGATFPIPSVNILPRDGVTGSGASVSVSMGIGTVSVAGFGSGYTLPPSIGITTIGGVGTGASIISGLGVTISNVTLTNIGVGYTTIPTLSVTSPVAVASSATGFVGFGISAISVSNPGVGYTFTIPTISITSPASGGSGAAASVDRIITTNVIITNNGIGYTAADVNQSIITYSPVGTSSTVGFGVSTINVTSTGIGYTTAVSAGVSISAPQLSDGVRATAISILGYSGILAGPGYATTNRIYFVASVSAGSIGISTGVGIGTLSSTDVANKIFDSSNATNALIGGVVSNVSISSPGSGYTSTSVLTSTNFDGANVGTGFSFVSGAVVNNYQFSDVLVLQSVGSASTSVDLMEYATLTNEDILGSFNADLSGSNARLLFNPVYRDNVVKVTKDYMNI